MSTESPYRRDNWFGHDDTPTAPSLDGGTYGTGDSPDANPGPAGEYRPDPNDPAAIIAFRILRKSATILCRRARDEPDDFDLHEEPVDIELSDPAVRPPTPTAGPQRYRVRVNEEHGYLSNGHSTGCVVADRPAEEFLAIVREWLEHACGRLPPSRREDLYNEAAALKHKGEIHDVEILRRIVEEARE